MGNNKLKSINVDFTQREVLYILHSLNEFIIKCENEIKKDPYGVEDITSMYGDDILHLKRIHDRIKGMALPIFGDQGLTVPYETL